AGGANQEPNPLGDCSWIADAIAFEMRSGFSRFLVCSDDPPMLRPLSQAIEVLFGETGKAKKVSDQPLDISKVLGVLSLANAVVQRSTTPRTTRNEDDEDVEMADSEPHGDEPDYRLEFVESCRRTLMRLMGREQGLIVLNQLPRTVKNMPQPILNGLQEAMQKGGRVYNNGPINMQSIGPIEADQMTRSILSLLADVANTARGGTTDGDSVVAENKESRSAQSLYKLVCEIAPMLVEILGSR
ncbi:hypothetical protein EV175_006847, partial [Coemansia sp. RSA 1933]